MSTDRINRILEIDIDTDRTPNIALRIIAESPLRPNGGLQVNHSPATDMFCLSSALLASILQAEKEGTYKKGKAMKAVIDYLNETYVNPDVETYKATVDEETGKLTEEE